MPKTYKKPKTKEMALHIIQTNKNNAPRKRTVNFFSLSDKKDAVRKFTKSSRIDMMFATTFAINSFENSLISKKIKANICKKTFAKVLR